MGVMSSLVVRQLYFHSWYSIFKGQLQITEQYAGINAGIKGLFGCIMGVPKFKPMMMGIPKFKPGYRQDCCCANKY